MESEDKQDRKRDACIVASVMYVFSLIPVLIFQMAFLGAVHPLPLLTIPLAFAALFGVLAYFSVGKHRDYDEVGLTEMLSDLSIFDGRDEITVDFSDEADMLLLEPVLSSVQGTPPPLLPAGRVVQDRVTGSHPIDPEVQESIVRHAAQPLVVLPPLPTRLPVIQKAIATDIPSETSTPVVPPTPRDTLEAKPLKEVISDLGPEGYVDALLYCLSLSEKGSPDTVLTARGSTHGLGARGIRKDDGTTCFTHSDVLKMLRKARGAVSANLHGDIQLSGEGRS
jgi:hypothetical protein